MGADYAGGRVREGQRNVDILLYTDLSWFRETRDDISIMNYNLSRFLHRKIIVYTYNIVFPV